MTQTIVSITSMNFEVVHIILYSSIVCRYLTFSDEFFSPATVVKSPRVKTRVLRHAASIFLYILETGVWDKSH
jgi:hypothetical protein